MAQLLPIKVFSCPVLRNKSRALKTNELQNEDIKQLILDMEKTMLEKDGIGLAAPQIGKNIKVIVVNTESGVIALINPKILRKSWKKEIMEEGCLSLPEVFGLVKRSAKVNLVALNKNGKKVKFKATGMFARVLQHEIDHLSGVMFIDKATEITKGKDILEKEFSKK